MKDRELKGQVNSPEIFRAEFYFDKYVWFNSSWNM